MDSVKNISRFQKNTGVGQILDRSFETCPDKVAIVFGNWRITYRELESLVYKTAHYMQAHGVKKGSHVAIISRNCPEFIIAEIAILKLGAVVVKFNWRLTPEEMENLVIRNQCNFAFYKAENPVWGENFIERVGKRFPVVRLEPEADGSSALYRILEGVSDEPVETVVADSDPSHHMHTSGTTGTPKTVVYYTAHYLNQLESMLTAFDFPEGLTYQFISQLFHSACIGAFLTLAQGGKLVLFKNFEIVSYVESLVKEKVYEIGVIPLVLKSILDYIEANNIKLPDLKVVTYSTCPMSPELLARALSMIDARFCQAYGMTEMASTVTALFPEDHLKCNGKYLKSVGRCMPGAEVSIQDENGNILPANQVGEICMKARGSMKGYLGMEEATAYAMRGGWYHTMDAGYLDEDGYLYLKGRMDNMIISGGENIYPEEVDNVLLKMPEILECAVLGAPDEKWGEHVKACIVLRPGAQLDETQIKAFCRENMPAFRIPKEIVFMDELPKNATGKVVLSELK